LTFFSSLKLSLKLVATGFSFLKNGVDLFLSGVDLFLLYKNGFWSLSPRPCSKNGICYIAYTVFATRPLSETVLENFFKRA